MNQNFKGRKFIFLNRTTFGVVTALAVAASLSFLAVKSLEQISMHKDQVVFDYSQRVITVEMFRLSIEKLSSRSRAYLLPSEDMHYRRFRQASVELIRQTDALQKLFDSDQEREKFKEVMLHLKGYREAIDDAFNRLASDEKMTLFRKILRTISSPQKCALSAALMNWYPLSAPNLKQYERIPLQKQKTS